MTHVITADEGKWITEVGFTPEQETAPSFWHEVRTSDPDHYTEVTDTTCKDMETAWQQAHPQPEPEQASHADTQAQEVEQ